MKTQFIFLLLTLPLIGFSQKCDEIKLKLIASDTIVCSKETVELKAQIEGTDSAASFFWKYGFTGPTHNVVAYEDMNIPLKAVVNGCEDTFKTDIDIKVLSAELAFKKENYGNLIFLEYRRLDEVKTEFSITKNGNPCDTSYGFVNDTLLFIKDKGTYEFNVEQEVLGSSCFEKWSSEITVTEDYNYMPYLANAINPNSVAEVNRQFRPYQIAITQYEISIFNQNGNMIFNCSEPDCFWDGRDQKGKIVPSDFYYYVVTTIDAFGFKKVFNDMVFVLN